MDLRKRPSIHSGGIEDKSHREQQYIYLLDMKTNVHHANLFFRQTRILQLGTLI